jgi:large subunit ribosomal protein L25
LEKPVPEIQIESTPRTEFGKGAARRLRRADQVPAVVYGHGQEPVHVALPSHELTRALRAANVLLELSLDGSPQLVLPKAIQRDPLRGTLDHVDLVLVRRGEKVTVEIPLVVHGDIDSAGMLAQQITVLPVLAEATSIPERIEVSVEGFEIGQHMTAGEIALPDGTELATDPDTLVLHVVAAPTAADLEAEIEGEGEAVEGAAGVESGDGEAGSADAAESADDATEA